MCVRPGLQPGGSPRRSLGPHIRRLRWSFPLSPQIAFEVCRRARPKAVRSVVSRPRASHCRVRSLVRSEPVQDKGNQMIRIVCGQLIADLPDTVAVCA